MARQNQKSSVSIVLALIFLCDAWELSMSPVQNGTETAGYKPDWLLRD